VDKSRINGNLKNGVLELHLPKAAKAQPRKIDIQMG
jgi:HSP20 family molecular chaperone IbpA